MAMSPDMDDIYRRMPPECIPWNIESPPAVLIRLLESRAVSPCKAVDLGCSAGHYAIFLAGHGFQVTGVDLSPAAIGMARQNAEKKGVRCTFIVADVLGDTGKIGDSFLFAYDWELLHHIFPPDRERYAGNVARLLAPGGKYLSVCFHEDDPQFGGRGKMRLTPIGTSLYFSSISEIGDLFSPHFSILDLKAISIPGKTGMHVAVCAFMEKP